MSVKFELRPYKPVITKVSLSTPILTKSVCIRCVKGPTWYFHSRETGSYQSPHDLLRVYEWIQARTKRFCTDFYLFDPIAVYTTAQTFGYQHVAKSYTCRAHKNKAGNTTNNVEFLSCECGSTVWAISTAAFTANKPEIINRKSSRTFPQKFKF